MRVTFWARLEFAKHDVAAALQAVPGAQLRVVATLPELLDVLPNTEFLVLVDAPAEQARQVVANLGTSPVRHMHFNSAGRDGFNAAGIPSGITVTNAGGALAPTVAEHAFALLLGLTRKLPAALAQQREQQWLQGMGAGARSLEGGTLLLIGLGFIGREVAIRARAFGMRVVAVNRTVRPEPLVDEVLPLSALHDVLPRADAIIACIAHSPETAGMLDRAALARCRPEVIIVNVGRGGLVDSEALAEALRAGRIAGAGLDVTDAEPLPPGHPLWSAPNLIVTPHIAGASDRGGKRLAAAAASRLAAAIAGA